MLKRLLLLTTLFLMSVCLADGKQLLDNDSVQTVSNKNFDNTFTFGTGQLSLQGNFTITGAYATTLTVTNTTALTLPTSGTLATLAGVESLSNKSVSLADNTLTGTLAQFNTALSDGDFATIAGSETLTSKTVNLSNNTVTGTIAQFNTALSDADFATIAGSEALTSKTVNLANNTLTGTTAQFNTALSDGDFATLAGSEILTNKEIASGNLSGTTNVSGGKLQFPASQSASADANTLDDYEQGTWTPSVGGNATYTTQNGTYTKIGRVVTLFCELKINVIGTGSTNQITGVPFAVDAGRGYGAVYYTSLATNVTTMVAGILSSTITLYSSAAAAAGLSGLAVLGNGAEVQFTLSYEAAN